MKKSSKISWTYENGSRDSPFSILKDQVLFTNPKKISNPEQFQRAFAVGIREAAKNVNAYEQVSKIVSAAYDANLIGEEFPTETFNDIIQGYKLSFEPEAFKDITAKPDLATRKKEYDIAKEKIGTDTNENYVSMNELMNRSRMFPTIGIVIGAGIMGAAYELFSNQFDINQAKNYNDILGNTRDSIENYASVEADTLGNRIMEIYTKLPPSGA